MAGEFFESLLVGGELDPALCQRVAASFYLTIARSYAADGSRQTRAETRRRFAILERAFRELRHEHRWSVERILEALPRVLRCQLDGAPWDPTSERRIWSPS